MTVGHRSGEPLQLAETKRDFVPAVFEEEVDTDTIRIYGLQFEGIASGWKGRRLCLEAHIRYGFAELDAPEFCALIERSGERLPGPVDDVRRDIRRLKFEPSEPTQSHDDFPVFVTVVEVLEDSEWGRPVLFPAVVRLQPLDQCHEAGIVAKIADQGKRIREPGRAVTDGKVQTAPVLWQLRGGSAEGDPVDGVVETRTKVLEAVSEHRRPSREVRWAGQFKPENPFRRIAVRLKDESIGVRVSPGKNLFIDVFEVFVRPVELGARAGEVVRHGV